MGCFSHHLRCLWSRSGICWQRVFCVHPVCIGGWVSHFWLSISSFSIIFNYMWTNCFFYFIHFCASPQVSLELFRCHCWCQLWQTPFLWTFMAKLTASLCASSMQHWQFPMHWLVRYLHLLFTPKICLKSIQWPTGCPYSRGKQLSRSTEKDHLPEV